MSLKIETVGVVGLGKMGGPLARHRPRVPALVSACFGQQLHTFGLEPVAVGLGLGLFWATVTHF